MFSAVNINISLTYEDPMGQSVKETRTDLEVTISGSGTENLVAIEVLKPIIRTISRDSTGEVSNIIQKASLSPNHERSNKHYERND